MPPISAQICFQLQPFSRLMPSSFSVSSARVTCRIMGTGARVRARVMGYYRVCNDRVVSSQIRAIQVAAATQRPTALWCQNSSGRDLHGQGRVRQGALPLSWRIVDGPEN